MRKEKEEMMTQIKKYLVINGVNLNMLGIREPHIYGTSTLEDVERDLRGLAKELNVSVDFFQSNYEGALIDQIHKAYQKYDGIIINPGAFTHTSYALRDALSAVNIPFVEIHITNNYKREEFRITVTADKAVGQIQGFGIFGYQLALRAIVNHTENIRGDLNEKE